MERGKVGKFILEIRKQRGFTQKELAEKIGVSDKTISKWECGNSVPDTTYLQPLCKSLDISVNELLSGQCLTEESYSEKAEENIMALMKENENNKKEGILRVFIGFFLIITCFAGPLFTEKIGFSFLQYYLDASSLFDLAVLYTGMLLLAGKKTKGECFSFLQKISLPGGILMMLFQFILMLRHVDDMSTIGPHISSCVLSLFYAAAVYLAVSVRKERCE